MNLMNCEKCGSGEFVKSGNAMMCCYCRSKYSKPIEKPTSTIDLTDDVQRLLDKCKREPRKASKYASLILDIDPTNKEALEYL